MPGVSPPRRRSLSGPLLPLPGLHARGNGAQQQQREEHLGVRDPQLTESIASSSRGLDGIHG